MSCSHALIKYLTVQKILSKIRMYNDTKMINHPLSNIISQTKLLEKLADQYGTPTYVYSKSRLEHNISELLRAISMSFANYQIYYAVKANSNINIIRILKNKFISDEHQK